MPSCSRDEATVPSPPEDQTNYSCRPSDPQPYLLVLAGGPQSDGATVIDVYSMGFPLYPKIEEFFLGNQDFWTHRA